MMNRSLAIISLISAKRSSQRSLRISLLSLLISPTVKLAPCSNDVMGAAENVVAALFFFSPPQGLFLVCTSCSEIVYYNHGEKGKTWRCWIRRKGKVRCVRGFGSRRPRLHIQWGDVAGALHFYLFWFLSCFISVSLCYKLLTWI